MAEQINSLSIYFQLINNFPAQSYKNIHPCDQTGLVSVRLLSG